MKKQLLSLLLVVFVILSVLGVVGAHMINEDHKVEMMWTALIMCLVMVQGAQYGIVLCPTSSLFLLKDRESGMILI